jgi:hypothetical protein
MKLLHGFIFLFFGFAANSQKLIKGLVLEAEKNTPVPNASVFLNTTAIGTITNEQGSFSFTIPNGRFELVVSAIGYETYAQNINATDAPDFLTIKMKIKVQEMEAVTVEPYEKNGWQKWGQFFVENFVGTSAFAKDCKIKNTEVIKFRYSKNKELSAFATEPLIIENKALGYTLRYQLESFQYSFGNNYLVHTGFPFFQPMQGSAARQRRWERNRREAFEGSMMHFMRAIYRNKLIEEGFELFALEKLPNKEKQRVKAAYASGRANLLNGSTEVNISQDTVNYYNSVMRQSDVLNLVGKDLLSGDSVAYSVNATTAGMDFKNYLLVIYKKMTPSEYRQLNPRASTGMMSEITLIDGEPIEIQANGNYFHPISIMSTGYWAWSEKIATMLPLDYK